MNLRRRDIKPDGWYLLNGSALLRLLAVADKLYNETRPLRGDERRDTAQMIENTVLNAIPTEDEP